jgi:hypothetical protein
METWKTGFRRNFENTGRKNPDKYTTHTTNDNCPGLGVLNAIA